MAKTMLELSMEGKDVTALSGTELMLFEQYNVGLDEYESKPALLSLLKAWIVNGIDFVTQAELNEAIQSINNIQEFSSFVFDFDTNTSNQTSQQPYSHSSGAAGLATLQTISTIVDYQSMLGFMVLGHLSSSNDINAEIWRSVSSVGSTYNSPGFLWSTGAKYECMFRFAIPSLSLMPSPTEDYWCRFGFQHLNISRAGAFFGDDWFTTSPPDNADGAAGYIFYDKDSSFFKCKSGVGALTETTTTTVLVQQNKIYVFRLIVNQIGSVLFYIDNTLVATHTNAGALTNPAHLGECIRLANKNVGNHTTALKAIVVDAVGYKQTLALNKQRAFLGFLT